MIYQKETLKLSVAIVSLFSSVTHASVVTFGSLTRDTTSPIIHDSLNQREWLGWDVLAGKTYAQALALTAIGQAYAGFTIARNVDAQLFVNAIKPDHTCTPTHSDDFSKILCFNNLPGTRRLGSVLGENERAPNAIGDYDFALFLSDNGVGQDFGYVLNSQGFATDGTSFSKVNEWRNLTQANYNATNDNYGWLFYRAATDNNEVPEPASQLLLGLGLLGIAATHKRKKA